MSRKKKVIIAGLVFLALLVVGTAYRINKNAVKTATNKEKAQSEQGQKVTVEVSTVALGDISAVSELTGTIKPKLEVSVVPKVPGRVQKVRIDVGDRVRAGDVLLELDKYDLQAQVKQARAGVAAARARLAQLRAGARSEEVAQAEAAVNQAKAAVRGAQRGLENAKLMYEERTASSQAVNAAETQSQVGQAQYESAQAMSRQAATSLKSATDNLQRMTDLFAKGAVTKAQLDAAQTQADLAKAQSQSAQAAVEQARVALEGARKSLVTARETHDSQTALKAQVDGAESQVHIAEANLKAAEARLTQIKAGARSEDLQAMEAQVLQAEAAQELAESQLANAEIKAPVAGLVAARNVDPGEMASPGLPVFSIVQNDEVYVETNITENLIGKVATDQQVQVVVDAYPDRLFSGRLANLAPTTDPRTKAFSVRVRLDNRDAKFKPGMFAAVRVVTESHRGVVIVPADAVVDRSGDRVVYLVRDGVAIEKVVKTGLTDGRTVEILKGLDGGETLVVAGQAQLADGVAVAVENEVK